MAEQKPIEQAGKPIEQASDIELGLSLNHLYQELFKLQGNRNPFIDHPEWASIIDYSAGFSD